MPVPRLAAGCAKVLDSRAITGCCAPSSRRSLSSVAAVLRNRSIIEISGVDAKSLLQGLMTNDMSLLDGETDGTPRCISTAFLNSKGRVLGDALVTRSPKHGASNKPGYLLDCPSSVAETLKNHLKIYKLRSKVKIKDASEKYEVVVSGVQGALEELVNTEGEGNVPQVPHRKSNDVSSGKFVDPRCAALGVRAIRPRGVSDDSWPGTDEVVPEERYNALRMISGVGEGTELIDAIPLEANLDILGSISFVKGCYVGQELTARTHFKGFVRKRVLPILFSEETTLAEWGSWESKVASLTPGSNMALAEGDEGKTGTLIAVSPEYNVGLALLRLAKVMSSAADAASMGSAFTVSARDGLEVEGRDGVRRRCLPLTPGWWPADLDPNTGKIPT